VQEEKRKEREALALLGEEERRAREEELAQDPLYEELPSGFGQVRIAFGPFLVLASLEFLFLGNGWSVGVERWLMLR
jgi:leader peptidase (prepilin peptidase)/N-methyltransferase